MRLRFTLFASLLSLLALTSSANAQQYVGYRPWYGPAYPAAYQPAAEPPVPAAGAEQPAEAAAEPADEAPTPDPKAQGDACTDGCECEECCALRLWTPPPGWFGSVEYNMWWNKTRTVPPLVTTSPPGTGLAQTGVLPGAQLLFGGDQVGDGLGSGGRLTFGKWLDGNETIALAGKFYAFRGKDGEFSQTSNGTTNLAIPFFDAQLGQENAYVVAFSPNGVTPFASGTINVQDRLDLLGAEAYVQSLIYDEPGVRFDLLFGYHMMRIDNDFHMDSTLVSQNAAIITPIGTSIFVQDNFDGRNEFHGGTLGLNLTAVHDRWTFNLLGKMSLGNMHQTIIIDGNTVVTAPNGVQDVRNEGLFALGSNQGTYSRDKVAYIPEAGVKVGYWVHPNVNVSLGYTFLYVSSVVMGGDQINRNLNLSQTNGGPAVGPNPNQPAFLGFRDTDFWAQGLNFGLECKF